MIILLLRGTQKGRETFLFPGLQFLPQLGCATLFRGVHYEHPKLSPQLRHL